MTPTDRERIEQIIAQAIIHADDIADFFRIEETTTPQPRRKGDNDELVIQRQHKKVAPFLLRTKYLDAAIDAAMKQEAECEAVPA